MIRSGSLRHIITLLVPHESYNAANEVIVVFSEAWQVRAEVTIKATAETIAAGEVSALTTYQIRMRAREIGTNWRIVYKGRTLDIKTIEPRGDRRDELLLTAHEVQQVQP